MGSSTSSTQALRVLWVATKSPWPPSDGGRLVQALTLEALAALGHRIRVLHPAEPQVLDEYPSFQNLEISPVPSSRRPRWFTLLRSLATGRPYTIERHHSPQMVETVRSLLEAEDWDLVHVEQLHALLGVKTALGKLPVVLRQQNVESDLWRGIGPLKKGPWRPLFRFEGRRLARFETWALNQATRVVTLTEEDGAQLQALNPPATLQAITAPFPPTLPAGDRRFSGDPALVILARGDWPPNRDGVEYFLREVWPSMKARLPKAELHLFGSELSGHPGVSCYPAPEDSREVFDPHSIFLVPLRLASGIRMKILEAWARGVPVVASPTAAGGLGRGQPRALEVADGAEEWIQAIEKLWTRPEYRRKLLEAGRERLEKHHEPVKIAQGIEVEWRRAMDP